jgi:hypothetical protein
MPNPTNFAIHFRDIKMPPHRERHRETKRDKETDRQNDRQTDQYVVSQGLTKPTHALFLSLSLSLSLLFSFSLPLSITHAHTHTHTHADRSGWAFNMLLVLAFPNQQ